jgi:hypothetical protein
MVKNPFKKKPVPKRNEWIWWDEKVNEISRMVRSAEPGRRHVVDAIHASYQIAGITGLLTWQYDGLDLRGRWYVHGQRDLEGPFAAPAGVDMAVTLHLSNRQDINCDVVPCLVIRGHTEDVLEM